MKASKIAVLMIGLVALLSSCQKEDMPGPNSNCPSHQQDNGGNLRVSDQDGTDNNSGGSAMGDGTGVTQDTVIIVGGGDDDRDGGGIVGGGDGDRDGGRMMQENKKNK